MYFPKCTAAVLLQATAGGYALTFPLQPPAQQTQQQQQETGAAEEQGQGGVCSDTTHDSAGDGTKINLWSSEFR